MRDVGSSGARRLAVIAGRVAEHERVRAVPVGDEFEEGLVDRAEFFGAEVAVVDAPPAVR